MRRYLLFAVVTLALLAPTTTVSASDGGYHGVPDLERFFNAAPERLDIAVAPDAMRLHVGGLAIEGEDAAEVRYWIDTFGDQDGTVSSDEVASIVFLVKSQLDLVVPHSFNVDLVTVDGKTPQSKDHPFVHVEQLELDGAEGPVTSTETILVDLWVLLRFETVDTSLSTHTVRLQNLWGDVTGLGMEHTPATQIYVEGYRSWEIQEDTLSPDAFQENLQAGVLVLGYDDLEEINERGDTLRFEIHGDPAHRMLGQSEEAPGPAVAMLLLFAVALLGLARRRR